MHEKIAKNPDEIRIIVRTCGERTTQKCVELCEKQGTTDIIEAVPFGESLRKSYKTAMNYPSKWVCMIDADVLLLPGTLQAAITELNNADAIGKHTYFCLDGFCQDKIMMKRRRAGIHIYRTELLEQGYQYIDDLQLKPESHVRKSMALEGFPTYSKSPITFGLHDYEQYYVDLWRKSVCQTQKLPKRAIIAAPTWKILSTSTGAKKDDDFLVIYEAHKYGIKRTPQIVIDKNVDYDAAANLARLNIIEKEALPVGKIKIEGNIL